MSSKNACSHCGQTIQNSSRPGTAASCGERPKIQSGGFPDGDYDDHYSPTFELKPFEPQNGPASTLTGHWKPFDIADSGSHTQTVYSQPGSLALPGPQEATQHNGLRSHIKQAAMGAAKGAAHVFNPRNLLPGRRGSQAPVTLPAEPAFGAPCTHPSVSATSESMQWRPTTPAQQVATSTLQVPTNPFSPAGTLYQNPNAATSHASIVSERSGLVPEGKRPFTNRQFIPGHLIWAPHHVTAQDLSLTAEESTNCVQSAVAKISSKRRLMVVLWCYPKTLFCLPCATNSGNGFNVHTPGADVMNVYLFDPRATIELPKTSKHKNLSVFRFDKVCEKPVSVALDKACTVDMREEIQIVGNVFAKDTKTLVEMWLDYADLARFHTEENE